MAVILTLLAIGIYVYSGYDRWKLGAEAGTKLRQVHTAQKTYLAEHPTKEPSDLEPDDVIPYLSNGATALPTVEDLNGNQLDIKVDEAPPYIDGHYDPSGKSDDGQWDVGQ